MKKKVVLAAALALFLSIVPVSKGPILNEAAAREEIKVVVQGEELDLSTPAYLEKGTTIVPLREIAEALGAEVHYNVVSNGARTVRLERGNRSAVLTIGLAGMTANGKTIQLNAAVRTVGGVTMVPLRALSEALGAVVVWDGAHRLVTIEDPVELPTIDTESKLRELLQSMSAMSGSVGVATTGASIETTSLAGSDNAVPDSPPSPTVPMSAETARQTNDEGDYSLTNVQVQGVDEADWAKTDGRFIYQLSGSRVLITDISNPSRPTLAANLDYAEKDEFYPRELYVDDKRLIVIGDRTLLSVSTTGSDEPSSNGVSGVSIEATTRESVDIVAPTAKKIGIWPPIAARKFVKTLIYELSDDGQPKLVRETEQEGSYLSSRKLDSALYIVTNKYNYAYPMYGTSIWERSVAEGDSSASEPGSYSLTSSFEPLYSDSAMSGVVEPITLPLDQIHYFPEPADSSMMLIGALDLDHPDQQLQVSAYLGSGETIYASERHLYVAISKHTANGKKFEQQTQFHKFRLDQGNIVYIGEGTVPGLLLNQFSMDEYNGYLRVALTNGDMWASGAAGSTNNIYVLDEKLATIGKLEGLAPGERIYSVRFMGDRAYMVTFRNVDPLFAIDLRSPANPSVLGQLKIPGYSDYLHPYDENHLIGFGKETVELPVKGMSPDETAAYYQGMKIALFDVTDVRHPKEMFKEIIGDRGTHSELLNDHKALLFSRDKGLMAFPVELHEITNKESMDGNSFPAYGEFTYQGAYVYRIDLQEGFKLRGRISHLTDEDLLKSGAYGYDYNKSVKRILYASDTLYTLSEAMVKANDLNSLEERGSLVYPAMTSDSYYPGGGGIMPLPMPIVTE